MTKHCDDGDDDDVDDRAVSQSASIGQGRITFRRALMYPYMVNKIQTTIKRRFISIYTFIFFLFWRGCRPCNACSCNLDIHTHIDMHVCITLHMYALVIDINEALSLYVRKQNWLKWKRDR